MTDGHEPTGTDSGIHSIGTLLREMTLEDSELFELPDDLWAAIEAGVDLAD